MSHFNDVDLHRWSASGPGADRERIVAHVAECSDCARRYAGAIRRRHLDEALPAADAEEFARIGRSAGAARHNRRRALSLAAAAVLVVIVAVPLLLMRREQRGKLNLRGGNIQTLAPSGAVSRSQLQFDWAGGIAAARYRLVIGDSTRVITTIESDKSPLPMPAELRAQLQPGVEYWWSVTALDGSGVGIVTSPRTTFTVRADP